MYLNAAFIQGNTVDEIKFKNVKLDFKSCLKKKYDCTHDRSARAHDNHRQLSYHVNDFYDMVIILSICALHGMGIVMLCLDIQ